MSAHSVDDDLTSVAGNLRASEAWKVKDHAFFMCQ